MLKYFRNGQDEEEEAADDGEIHVRFGRQKPSQAAASVDGQQADEESEQGRERKGKFGGCGPDACSGTVGRKGEAQGEGLGGGEDFHIVAVSFFNSLLEGAVENFYEGQYEQYGKGKERCNRRGDVRFEERPDDKGRNEEQIGKSSHDDGGNRRDFYFICTICKAGGEGVGGKGYDKQYEFGD